MDEALEIKLNSKSVTWDTISSNKDTVDTENTKKGESRPNNI